MGKLGLRKILKRETTWREKGLCRHKCNFKEHCILKVILLNNKVNYYNVMKCLGCLSFISIREPGNIQGYIFDELTKEQKSLPLLTAYYKRKNLIITFADLENVSYGKD